MKRFLIGIIFALLTFNVHAQAPSLSIIPRLTANAPVGYQNSRYSSWSPDSSKIAIRYELQDERQTTVQTIWHIYDVASGSLLQAFADFIGWYHDSQRVFVRETLESPPRVVNVNTGTVLFELEDTGSLFQRDGLVSSAIYLREPIENIIFNGDSEASRVRIYDAETGAIRLTVENASFFNSAISPDKTRFAVGLIDSGISVYDLATSDLIASLEDYRFLRTWSPNSQQLVVFPVNMINPRLGPRYIWTIGEELSAPLYNLTSGFVWSPDGTRVVAGSDYTKIRIYDSASGELLQTIRGFDTTRTYVTLWQGDYLLGYTGDYRHTGIQLFVWDLSRDEFAFKDHVDIANEYSLTGNILEIFESWFRFRQVDLLTGDTLIELDFDFVVRMRSPNHHWVVRNDITGEGIPTPILVYRMNSFEQVGELDGFTEIIYTMNWSPDGRYLAAIGEPHLVMVWEFIETE
jgi:WD40 repeat protein